MVERKPVPTPDGELVGYRLLRGKVFSPDVPIRVVAGHFHLRVENDDGIKAAEHFVDQAALHQVDLMPTSHNTTRSVRQIRDVRDRRRDKDPDDPSLDFKVYDAAEYAAHENGQDKHVLVVSDEPIILPPVRLPILEANRHLSHQGAIRGVAHLDFANYSLEQQDVYVAQQYEETKFHFLEIHNAAAAKSYEFREDWNRQRYRRFMNCFFDRFAELQHIDSNARAQQFMATDGYDMNLSDFVGSDGHGREDFLDTVMVHDASVTFPTALRTADIGCYVKIEPVDVGLVDIVELKAVTKYDAIGYKVKNAVSDIKRIF